MGCLLYQLRVDLVFVLSWDRRLFSVDGIFKLHETDLLKLFSWSTGCSMRYFKSINQYSSRVKFLYQIVRCALNSTDLLGLNNLIIQGFFLLLRKLIPQERVEYVVLYIMKYGTPACRIGCLNFLIFPIQLLYNLLNHYPFLAAFPYSSPWFLSYLSLSSMSPMINKLYLWFFINPKLFLLKQLILLLNLLFSLPEFILVKIVLQVDWSDQGRRIIVRLLFGGRITTDERY